MELFKISGVIDINDEEAKKSLDDVSNKGQDTHSKLSNAFSKIGSTAVKVGKTIATGMAVGATAVTGMVTKSIQEYAEYEQLVGGVETLFKDSAGKVQEYAKNAYKTAGMSANDYMETVTSFSASLLQSLDGDTNKASEKANMAITDMSDNANKMGTDMSLIQNAYQGFAKQNFMMLDNLKLGYGGTKEEMERLLKDAEKISGIKYDVSSYADIVDAIHVVQTEMGITGTTAKEASSTISGSINSMKGSWQNLLTAISSDDLPFDDYMNAFIDSVSTVMDNIMPRIEIALNGIVQLVGKLAPKIVEALPGLVATLLPSIVSATTSLLNSISSMLPNLINVLVTSVLPNLISGIESIFNTLISMLPSLIQSICSALPSLIPLLVNALVSTTVTLCTMLPQIIQPIIDYLPETIVILVTTLLENLPTLIAGLGRLVVGIIQAIPQVLSALWESITTLVSKFVTSLFDKIKNWILKLFPKSGESIIKVLSTIKDAIKTWIANIKEIFSVVVEFISTPFKLAWNAIKLVWNVVVDYFKMIWNNIKAVFSVVDSVLSGDFKGAWEGIKKIWSNVKQFFSNVVSNIKNAFSNVLEILTSPFKKAKDAIKKIVDNIKGFFSNLKLKFPSIKLPHFTIKPKGWEIGDLLKGKIPKLGIDWYAKAMDSGMILDEPTIFGVNKNGQPMAGGEAGSETVVGTSSLMSMIQQSVNNQNAQLEVKLDTLINILMQYLPDLSTRQLCLDSGELVGALVNPMDKALAEIYEGRSRGR